MKLPVLITCILLSGINALKGQYLPTITDGNRWELFMPVGSEDIILKEELKCDTIILGQKYNILTTEGRSKKTYLREDTLLQNIYFFNFESGADKLLLTYNWTQGDSILFGYGANGEEIYLVCDSVYYKEAYGAVRKHIHFNQVDLYIEGVGNYRNGIDVNTPHVAFIRNFSNGGQGCTATDNPYEPDLIRVSPNPFTDYINIEYTGFQSRKYSVFDIFGNLMAEKLISRSDRIETSGLLPGIYFLYVDDGRIIRLAKTR